MSCDLDFKSLSLSIKTSSHQLYPDDDITAPTQMGRDYFVDLSDCRSVSNISEVNISLSILFNENVFEHIPYVVCIIEHIDADTGQLRTITSEVSCLIAGSSFCDSTIRSTTTVAGRDTTTVTPKSHSDNVTTTNTTTEVDCDFVTCGASVCVPQQVFQLCALLFVIACTHLLTF